MSFETEVLFPNPKLNNDETAFIEGTEELQNDQGILDLKKKIREALSKFWCYLLTIPFSFCRVDLSIFIYRV